MDLTLEWQLQTSLISRKGRAVSISLEFLALSNTDYCKCTLISSTENKKITYRKYKYKQASIGYYLQYGHLPFMVLKGGLLFNLFSLSQQNQQQALGTLNTNRFNLAWHFNFALQSSSSDAWNLASAGRQGRAGLKVPIFKKTSVRHICFQTNDKIIYCSFIISNQFL